MFMNLAKTIDHTLLRADATEADIVTLCDEARSHGFYSVCVNSSWINVAAQELEGSGILVVAVCGFPLGAMGSEAKAFEAAEAVSAGAGEVDMVISIGRLKGGDQNGVRADVGAVIAAVAGLPVKVILETCLLTRAEKILACEISAEAGAAFVKTSTGFSTGGATIEDVQLMAESVGGKCQVKASGGIRDSATALSMLRAGATRLGTSNGIAILSGQTADGY